MFDKCNIYVIIVNKFVYGKRDIQATLNIDPFPHVIIDNFYNEEELN